MVNVKVTGRCIQASRGIKVKHRIRSTRAGPGLAYGCDLVEVAIRVM